MMNKFFALLTAVLCSFNLAAQTDTSQHVTAGRRNSPEQQNKPYVILISADGFRYDYADKYHAENLIALRNEGVQAESMIPSFPSLTFPNHYSIVTGLYPSHHGLVSNTFYDPQRKTDYRISSRSKVQDGSWYGGTPLWVLAEKQHMVSASFYWVGSEAAIQEISPTYFYHFNEQIDIDKRVQTVVDWLKLPADRRPHLITFYFPEVDHAGHMFGPDSPETEQAVKILDCGVKKLNDAVKATGLPVSFVFVSDHGMTLTDTAHTISQPPVIDTAKFIIPSGGDVVVNLYARNKMDIASTYNQLKQMQKGFKTYLKSNVPSHLHYSAMDDRHGCIGDIVLIAERPYVFNFSRGKSSPGRHGFDPSQVKDMHATFYAWGPAFRSHAKIASFQNVDVYPVITEILGLKSNENIDGTKMQARKILKSR